MTQINTGGPACPPAGFIAAHRDRPRMLDHARPYPDMTPILSKYTPPRGREADFPALFSPLTIRGITIPNRIVMAPMSSKLGNRDGTVSEGSAAYYRERAAGGTGMITVEYNCIDSREGRSNPRQLLLDEDRYIVAHKRLSDLIRAEGATPAIQLHHSGRQTSPDYNKGNQPVSASPFGSTTYTENGGARALRPEEIERLIEKFAQAAGRAVKAGYDVIELHGAHSYLLQSFLSPFTNRRDDDWGGDFERRLRFPCAVVEAIRTEIGCDRVLSYRFSAAEYVEGGLTIEDSEKIVPRLVAAGVDLLHVSAGIGESLAYMIEPMSAPEGARLDLARRIRAAAGVPVTAVGQIRWPEMADGAIARGETDLIALGRPLLADPHWAKKAHQGRVSDILACTSCNWCLSNPDTPTGFGCAENVRAGNELAPRIPADAGQGRVVVVVGAGPGGIVAALQLKDAGFKPVLFEKRDRLGGTLISAAAPPNKEKLHWYLEYLTTKVIRAGIDLRLGQMPSPDEIAAISPTAVLLATGAVERNHSTGLEPEDAVQSAYDYLIDKAEADEDWTGRRVLVQGGGETGCEAAEHLASRGAEVALLTRSTADGLARNAEYIYRIALLERLQKSISVTVHEHSRITGIENGEAVVTPTRTGQNRRLPVDMVLMAAGRIEGSGLETALVAKGLPVKVIGDARKIRRIGDAVWDAYAAVTELAGVR